MLSRLLYSEDVAGGKMVAKQGAQVRTDPSVVGRGTFWTVDPGNYVILTGFFYSYDNIYYYQTTNGVWAIVDMNNMTGDWSLSGRESVSTYSQTQAQYLVNKIIKNNYAILCNNLICARYANRLTSEERQLVRDLQERLQARNSALQAEGLVDNIQTATPAGYAELSGSLDALMADERIGIATWVVVVIACAVIAATATAAYYAYRSLADESEQDIKYSKDLLRVLTSKLTEEEYQQLLNETKGIVTKAKIKQAIGSYGNVLKLAAFAVAGYVGYKFIKQKFL